MEQIQKTADRAAGLTRQLLAFSRKQVLQRKDLDLNTMVEEVSAMLRRLIGEDVELLLTLGPNAGHVNADPGQLEQVLMNLAVNSRDAMPSGGTLGVETDCAQVEAAPPDRPEARPAVRGAASHGHRRGDGRGHAGTHRTILHHQGPGKGTGLGLVVHGVVRQHGAPSGAQRGERRDLPPQVATPVEPDRIAETVGRETAGRETILLAEDEDDVRARSPRRLERQGYRIIEATDGLQALRLYEAEGDRIDLVLSDVVMPRMSGRELVDRVRAIRPDMRVLYMSGYTEDAIVRHGVRDASTVLLGKPFAPADLLAKIREVLDRVR